MQLLRLIIGLVICVGSLVSVGACEAEQPPSAVGSVMKLLQSGRVPASRLPSIVEQIARRGNEQDLAFLFDQALHNDTYDEALRLNVLKLLADAAAERGVIPAGDLGALVSLLDGSPASNPAMNQTAIRLAGLWKVAAAADRLKQTALSPDTPPRQQDAALLALSSIGGEVAHTTILELTRGDQSMPLRMKAVTSLVGLNVDEAAAKAAQVLSEATTDEDPGPLVAAFLDRQGGSDKLAESIEKTPPAPDVAKLALRAMYAVGRSDAQLAGVLGKIAGIDADPAPPTPQELQQLIARVPIEGDAARGEDVFRRADLSCMKCHAVSKGGGQVGPDLSPVGATSPVDYLLNSILDPDQQIKEAYQTRVVMTSEGLVLQGIIVDSTDERLVLKDAAGHQLTIPTADIEVSMEGKSLMPKGLTKFMTQDELLDLARFLSMLGRPGTGYEIRETPRMQRWRLVNGPGARFAEGILNASELQGLLQDPTEALPMYSRTNGELPLAEAVTLGDDPVVHLAGEFEVTQEGEVGVRLDAGDGVTMWIDDQPADGPEMVLPVGRGRHLVLLRVDTGELHGPHGAAGTVPCSRIQS